MPVQRREPGTALSQCNLTPSRQVGQAPNIRFRTGGIIHEVIASRAVGVATQLLSKELKAGFVEKTREEYIEVRGR